MPLYKAARNNLTALVTADGPTGGFVKDSDRATSLQARTATSTTAVLTASNLADIGTLKGLLFGMTLSNNGSDATNDIDIAAGSCIDSTGARFLVGSALTKQLDATWAAGTNAGGKMSAAAIANTTYHVFAILKDSDGTVDYGFDVSATAPTMPSGYTYFRRIGSIVRVSAAILGFVQVGDEFRLKVPVADIPIAATLGTSAITQALASVPIGIQVQAIVALTIVDVSPTSNFTLLATPLDTTDTAPSSSLFSLRLGNTNSATVFGSQTAEFRIRTNTSAQVRLRVDVSSADNYAGGTTLGWIDTRGRLA